MDEIPESRQSGANRQVVIVLIVLAIFAGVFIAKSIAGNAKDAGTPQTPTAAIAADAGSITSIHNDAVADYEAALKSGKPVYVLFHSLS